MSTEEFGLSAALVEPIFAPPENGWVEGLSMTAYHSDHAIMSSGKVRKALISAAHFKAAMDDLDTEEEDASSEAMQFGEIAHIAILEPARFLANHVRQPDFGDMRSSTNRKKRDEWREHQSPLAIILDEEDEMNLTGMMEALAQHRGAQALLREGIPELSGFWQDPLVGACRMRADYLRADLRMVIDYKTTRCARMREFSRDAHKLDYPVQAGFYLRGASAITQQKWEHFTFIAQEKVKPWAISIYEPTEGFLDIGERRTQRALGIIKSCRETGIYPAYPERAQPLDLPVYAYYDEGETE